MNIFINTRMAIPWFIGICIVGLLAFLITVRYIQNYIVILLILVCEVLIKEMARFIIIESLTFKILLLCTSTLYFSQPKQLSLLFLQNLVHFHETARLQRWIPASSSLSFGNLNDLYYWFWRAKCWVKFL